MPTTLHDTQLMAQRLPRPFVYASARRSRRPFIAASERRSLRALIPARARRLTRAVARRLTRAVARRLTRAVARRCTRKAISLAGALSMIGLLALTPLHNTVLQAILLGPDSLFPPPAARTVMVLRHGHRVLVPVRAGTVLEHLSFASAALGGHPEQYAIYLPPGYGDAANRTRRYPTLYLLHGAPGQPGDWVHGMHVQWLEDQGVATGALKPMIMVMPEGNGGVWRDSQYVNTHGGFKAEDLITRDVVQYVDAHYRTIADRRARAIAGISEGGYGAMNLGLKHLATFGTIVSISGYFAAMSNEVFAGNDPWGNDWALMKANSPMLYLDRLGRLTGTNLLIMDNTRDGPYTQGALAFAHALTHRHLPYTLLLQPAPNLLYAHYWPYWHAAFPTALAYISGHLLSGHPPGSATQGASTPIMPATPITPGTSNTLATLLTERRDAQVSAGAQQAQPRAQPPTR